VAKFIAASNANDVVPEYLQSGDFQPRDSVETISNAMDVGNPSNFVRMLDMYNHDVSAMRNDITGSAWTDEQTRQAIKNLREETGYTMDPHGAVGYLALQKFFESQAYQANGIFLETAHPAKFLETVEPLIDSKLEIPERLQKALTKEKQSIPLSNQFEEFKSFLLDSSN